MPAKARPRDAAASARRVRAVRLQRRVHQRPDRPQRRVQRNQRVRARIAGQRPRPIVRSTHRTRTDAAATSESDRRDFENRFSAAPYRCGGVPSCCTVLIDGDKRRRRLRTASRRVPADPAPDPTAPSPEPGSARAEVGGPSCVMNRKTLPLCACDGLRWQLAEVRMIRMCEVAEMAEAMRHREPLDSASAVRLGEQRIPHQLKPAPLQVPARAGAADRGEGLVQSSIRDPEAGSGLPKGPGPGPARLQQHPLGKLDHADRVRTRRMGAAVQHRARSNQVQPRWEPGARSAPVSRWSAAAASGGSPARSASSSAAIPSAAGARPSPAKCRWVADRRGPAPRSSLRPQGWPAAAAVCLADVRHDGSSMDGPAAASADGPSVGEWPRACSAAPALARRRGAARCRGGRPSVHRRPPRPLRPATAGRPSPSLWPPRPAPSPLPC